MVARSGEIKARNDWENISRTLEFPLLVMFVTSSLFTRLRAENISTVFFSR